MPTTDPAPRIPEPVPADRDLDLSQVYEVCEAATPAEECALRLDQWIEWRAPDGSEKYSIAEFERERDQEFWLVARTALPAALRLLAEARGEVERLRALIDSDPDDETSTHERT